ncbi:MAG: ATP-grasp domain-containing protein [Tissierellia bacterium]|nr:ATP-grasp domain-containing protein [Tissierellia bacterium]
MDLKDKKILVLGGTALSCEIIKQAKKQSAYVIVTDYLEDSPGKKIADKSFMISTIDVDAVVELIKKENIDGILTGFIDSILPYYQMICERANVPCYATKEQIDIAINKQKFKALCRKFDIPVVEEYEIKQPISFQDIEKIKYPVLIKPVDNSGARGIHICGSPDELISNYEKSLSFSASKKVLVERYMNANEATIFYIIQDGEVYLSAMADRYVKNERKGIIPLPVAYVFPSKHLHEYQETLNNKVVEMFKSIGINNGMIFIQTFVENGKCVFYEMGYRLTGSMEYKIISKLNGINPLEMMVNYALTGKAYEYSIRQLVNPNYKEWGFNLTYLAKPGKIGKISGIDEVCSLKGVIDVVLTYCEGDLIPQSAVGTLQQVVLRVFGIAKTKDEMATLIDKIHSLVSIYSVEGESMLLDVFDSKELYR